MSDDAVYFKVKRNTKAAEICKQLEDVLKQAEAATQELRALLRKAFGTRKTISIYTGSSSEPVGFTFDGFREAIAKYSEEYPGTFRVIPGNYHSDTIGKWYLSAKKGSNKERLKQIRAICKKVPQGHKGLLWPLFGRDENALLIGGATRMGLITLRRPGYSYDIKKSEIEIVSADRRILFDPKTGKPAPIAKGLEFSLTYENVNSKKRYAALKKAAKAEVESKEAVTAGGRDGDEDLFA